MQRLLPAILILSIGCAEGTGDTNKEVACDPVQVVAPTTDFFTDISEISGIRVDNFTPEPDPAIPINDHSRLAFADLDGDGFDDIVMHSLYPNVSAGIPFEHLVFLNNGDGTFIDHSDASGLRQIQAAFFAFGDVDNDGDQDLFAGLDIIVAGETHGMWLNDGTGVFSQLANSGIETPGSHAAANAAFFDADGDGNLDLFMGNGGTTAISSDFLYVGAGDGTFINSSDMEAADRHPSNGTVTCDIDNDGDLDVLVSTYSVSTELGHNHLWINKNGKLKEDGVKRGFAAQPTGNPWLESTNYGLDAEPVDASDAVGSNGFGLDCGDVDNDGDMDVFISAISHPVDTDYTRKWSDPTTLLINDGTGNFTDGTQEWKVPFNEGDVDAALIDFDNDGRLDASLSRDRKYESNYTEDDQKSWFGLLHQQIGEFVNIGVESGINDILSEDLLRMKGAQNHAWSDIDHDGDLDLLVGGRDQGAGRPNFLFRNDLGQDNRWLAIDLVGDGDVINRDAIGARVTVDTGDRVIVREKKSSRGMYNSEDTRTLHFGLGDAGCTWTVTVAWPDGTMSTLTEADVPEGRFTTITYGE